MSQDQPAARTLSFALLSSFETDIRNIVRDLSVERNTPAYLPSDVRSIAERRWIADHDDSLEPTALSDADLLEYTDFADLKKALDELNFSSRFKDLGDQLGAAVLVANPIRHRICHSRPLEANDFPTILDICRPIASRNPTLFSVLSRTLQLLETDPVALLGTRLPAYWATGDRAPQNNLPIPEFDDTGFLGRNTDRRNVSQLLKGQNPVVSIVGEGGVGKTALAQRCVFDLLDDHQENWDAIVWQTLKTTSLTAVGVAEVIGAISSTLSLFDSIGSSLGISTGTGRSIDGLVDEVADYLRTFRILLVLDNLETLDAEAPGLRRLLLSAPASSKILITSRIGFGEVEVRYPLRALDPQTAVQLLRAVSRLLNVERLSTQSNATLLAHAERLFLNPLLLKWFVAAIARGADTDELLARRSNQFREALSFCFSNLFDRLTSGEREIIHALVIAQRPLSRAECRFLLIINAPDDGTSFEWSLNRLQNSGILRTSSLKNGSAVYTLSEPAREFVAEQRPPTEPFFKRIRLRLRELRDMTQGESVRQATYKYDIFAVRARSNDQKIAAVSLRRALDYCRKQEITPARECIETARRLLPAYSETARAAAIVEWNSGDQFAANENFRAAVELDPDSAIAHFSYFQFLVKELEDFELALEHATSALSLDPGEPTLRTARARALMLLGRYSEAAPEYEDVLLSLAGRPLRWRIATRDQAAECYRRWAEQDLRNRDRPAAIAHFSRSFEIYGTALDSGDVDDKIEQHLGKLAGNFLRSETQWGDQASLERAFEIVEDAARRTDTRRLPTKEYSLLLDRLQIYPELLLRARSVLFPASGTVTQRLSTDSRLSDERGESVLRGEVLRLLREKGYGFIRAATGTTLFFHRNFLRQSTEWDLLKEGDAVAFALGSNHNGECATDIRKSR